MDKREEQTMKPQPGQQGMNQGPQASFNVVYWLANSYAMCFLPFLRQNFGREALGAYGLGAFILMVGAGSFGRIEEMWPYLGFWMFALFYHRMSTGRALRRGEIRHTRYDGDVTRWFYMKPSNAKLIGEPLFCLMGAGACELAGLSHGFALFIAWGALALLLVAGIDREAERKRLDAMRDAEIEMRYRAAVYRGEIDD
jgi:hypothetical protein